LADPEFCLQAVELSDPPGCKMTIKVKLYLGYTLPVQPYNPIGGHRRVNQSRSYFSIFNAMRRLPQFSQNLLLSLSIVALNSRSLRALHARKNAAPAQGADAA
jgi:hypothetical protein